jgi:NIMA (never in mitosis gene a)-related kinase
LPIKEACFGAAVFLVIDLIIHATAPDLGQAHLCIVRALVYLCVCIPTFQAMHYKNFTIFSHVKASLGNSETLLISTIDSKGNFERTVPSRLLDYTASEMKGLSLNDFFHPADRAKLQNELDSMRVTSMRDVRQDSRKRSSQVDRGIQFQMRRRDGTYVWVELVLRPVNLRFYRIVYSAIFRDITDELALENSTKAKPYFVIDPLADGQASRRAVDEFPGLANDMSPGASPPARVYNPFPGAPPGTPMGGAGAPPELQLPPPQRSSSLAPAPAPAPEDAKLTNPPTSALKAVLKTPSAREGGPMVLGESAQMLIERVQTPVICLDTTGKITMWNRQAAAITGFSKEETVGHSFLKFVSVEFKEVARKLCARSTESQGAKAMTCDLTILTKTGGSEDFALNVTPLRKQTGVGTGEPSNHIEGVMLLLNLSSQPLGKDYHLVSSSAMDILHWKNGSGAYGSVTLARRVKDNRIVAIKRIDLTGISRKAQRSLEREAKMLGQMNHTNIIALHDSFNEGTDMLIVMEYADGLNLRERVNRQKGVNFSTDRVVDWLSQLVSAMDHVHHHDVIHRDIKALNIFFTSSEELKLGDFGHAKMINEDRGVQTTCGTPETMAPEVILGRPYGAKADMWSVGCVLYEMITLCRPFEGATVQKLLVNVCKCNYPKLPDHCVDLHPIIKQLLNLDPDARPPAAELKNNAAILKGRNRSIKRQRAPVKRHLSQLMGRGVSKEKSHGAMDLRHHNRVKFGPPREKGGSKNKMKPAFPKKRLSVPLDVDVKTSQAYSKNQEFLNKSRKTQSEKSVVNSGKIQTNSTPVNLEVAASNPAAAAPTNSRLKQMSPQRVQLKPIIQAGAGGGPSE